MHIKGSFDSHFHNDINYYRGKCGMCQNYDLKSTNHRGCRCQIHTRKNLAFDDSCSYQRDDRSRSIKDIKKAVVLMLLLFLIILLLLQLLY